MFSVHFTGEAHERLGDDDVLSAIGEIAISDFQETFVSSLYCWTTREYEAQWHGAISHVLETHKPAALITEFTGEAARLWCWILYPVENTVSIQQRILFMQEGPPAHFRMQDLFSFISPRRTVTEEGQEISEWSVSLEALKAFFATMPSFEYRKQS